MTLILKIFRTHENVNLPKLQTQESACFDIEMNDAGKQEYTGFSMYNSPIVRPCGGYVHLSPGDRILVPTGLILDIPVGYSVRLHPRSGIALKMGLTLANAEGVIDSDYFHELFVMLHNTTQNHLRVANGDRIAQAELVRSIEYEIEETKVQPTQRTDRVGGLGSTGVSERKTFFVDVGDMPMEEISKVTGRMKKDVERWPSGRIKYDRKKKKEELQ